MVQTYNQPSAENPDYTLFKQDVLKSQNVYHGTKTSVQYLEKFAKETDESFKYRESNVTLTNFVKRTVNSSRNMIFRKPLEIIGNVSKEDIRTLNSLAEEVTVNVIRDGFTYIINDADIYDASVQTRADEITRGLEPYMYVVSRERVPNWSFNEDGEYMHFTINETYTEVQGYIQEQKPQQRIFKDDGTVEIWRDGALYETIETSNQFVPVTKVGYEDLPYVYDLAKLNLNHMNRRSELNRYLRIAASPVPIIYGAGDTATNITVGVDTALSFNNKDEGGFEWGEMTGSATNLLQDDLVTLEKQMVETAVSMVSADKSNQIKTATQVSSEIAEDESTLANIASIVQLGMNSALRLLEEMGGPSLIVHVNRDYTSNLLSPEQTNQYMSLYLQGVISHETLLELLVTGEVLDKELNIQQEITNASMGAGEDL